MCLPGEYENLKLDTIRKYDCIIIPPKDIVNISSNSVDLAINIDSMSEMDEGTVSYYIDAISTICKGFCYLNNFRFLHGTRIAISDLIKKDNFSIFILIFNLDLGSKVFVLLIILGNKDAK